MMKRIPQIRLKIALPLVSAGSPNATAGSTAGTLVAACESRPQTPQNRSPSAKLLPQPRQNELTAILLWRETSSDVQERSGREQVEGIKGKISGYTIQNNHNAKRANPVGAKHYLRQALSPQFEKRCGD